MSKSTLALILAAGQGTRMRSQKPKVLQPLAGQPMLAHLLRTVSELPNAQAAVIYGHKGQLLKQTIDEIFEHIHWVEQSEQLGTGHAVQQAIDEIKQHEISLILLGDAPLVSLQTMQNLCAAAQDSGFALLTAKVDDPYGYGRIIRDEQGMVAKIVEQKDANDDEQLVQEVNTGMMAISQEILCDYLPKLQNNNAQGEYYLTDLVSLLRADKREITAVIAQDIDETMGINNRAQLAQAEMIYRRRASDQLLTSGATLIDPTRIDIQGEVAVGQDVLIEPNVMFKGHVKLGNRVVIESGSVLIDCEIGDDSHILSHTRIEHSVIGKEAQIGPFARIRPNSTLADRTKVGNFVEIKAAELAEGVKVNHLSYVGDAFIGRDTNIGAGTITCNYDGANKHKTVIAENVFVGSNTALVAPVSIGKDVTIGAGSVISNSINDHALAFTRADLTTKENWSRPSKDKKRKR